MGRVLRVEKVKKPKIFLKKLRKTPCNFHVYLI